MPVLLDDPAGLRAGDPSGILAAFGSAGERLQASYEAARGAGVPFGPDIRSLTFCAMGGSAAVGDVVAGAFADRAPVPLVTLRGYRVPAAYGTDDLAMCVSYSGNTEETVAAFAEARGRGCRTVVVCGGGTLAERAREAGTPVVMIPADAPVPRAALSTMVGGVLGALVGTGVLSGIEPDVASAGKTLDGLTHDIGPDVAVADNEAKQIADWVGDRIPVIWGSEGVSAVAAWRWKTAFNENAEVPAFASALPELDHHEVVGWTGDRGKGFCLLILREAGEHERVQARLDATLEEIGGSGLEWREVRARGEGPLDRALSLSLFGDFASAYHALSRGIDPASMDAIIRVKERLEGDGG
ncbi:MAG: bifunctional phosphoglucose/phosphomannose isomerase [Actinomycetota bacterium]